MSIGFHDFNMARLRQFPLRGHGTWKHIILGFILPSQIGNLHIYIYRYVNIFQNLCVLICSLIYKRPVPRTISGLYHIRI